MAIVDYANFICECLTTDGYPDRADGWLLKHTDTGEQYIHVSGAWQTLRLGLSFAPPTKSGQVTTDANAVAAIVFGTPFIDDSYTIALSCEAKYGTPPLAMFYDKSAAGFGVWTVNSRNGANLPSILVSWVATRNYNA